MEKIKCAAIQYTLLTGETKVIEGFEHERCRENLRFMESCYRENHGKGLRDIDADMEGFVTTDGRFVNRYDAVEIARAAHQISNSFERSFLNSYDIK